MNAYQNAAAECWKVLKKHDLSYAEGIAVAAILHASISAESEVGAERCDGLLMGNVFKCREDIRRSQDRRFE